MICVGCKSIETHKTEYTVEFEFSSGKVIAVDIDKDGNGLKDYDDYLKYQRHDGANAKEGIGTYVKVEGLKIDQNYMATFVLIACDSKFVKWNVFKEKDKEIKTPVMQVHSVSAPEGITIYLNEKWVTVGGIVNAEGTHISKVRIVNNNKRISNKENTTNGVPPSQI